MADETAAEEARRCWRVALELAARLGQVPAESARAATVRVAAEPIESVTPGVVAFWVDVPEPMMKALYELARTLPPNPSEEEFTRTVHLTAALFRAPGATAAAGTTARGPAATVPVPPPASPSASPVSGRGGTAGVGAPRRADVPRLLGPYRLLNELGHGGMGIVFRARHETLGTLCAVKVLVAGELTPPDLLARFQREAASVAHLGRHPNIVSVSDLGRHGNIAYYAMDLVEGASLRAVLEKRSFAPAEAARLIEKVARAVDFANSHGIIHRDVKPDNILLRADGEPLVTDFGLAHDVAATARLSGTGQLIGTPAYMAPEQVRGDVLATDARTDVYALGAVLYEILTGTRAHPEKAIGLIYEGILSGRVAPAREIKPDLPPDLETICTKCLRVEPAERFGSAAALADELHRWLGGGEVRSESVGRQQARLEFRRAVGVVALTSIVATVALFLLLRVLEPAPGGGGASIAPAAAPGAETIATIAPAAAPIPPPTVAPDGKGVVAPEVAPAAAPVAPPVAAPDPTPTPPPAPAPTPAAGTTAPPETPPEEAPVGKTASTPASAPTPAPGPATGLGPRIQVPGATPAHAAAAKVPNWAQPPAAGPATPGKRPAALKVLLVVTNCGQPNRKGEPTGFFLQEVIFACAKFDDNKVQFDFASPKGGKAPYFSGWNIQSPALRQLYLEKPEFMQRFDRTLAPAQVKAEEYGAIFFMGGYGALFDFPASDALQRIAARIYDQGGAVGSVCCGAAGLANLKVNGGKYLVKGREVACMSDDEITGTFSASVLPIHLTRVLADHGAVLKDADHAGDGLVVSDRLVTGRTEKASWHVALELVRLLDRPAEERAKDKR